jgi:3-phenylpropionate/trans-cinnamate dioxygenase ferredoxin subunit
MAEWIDVAPVDEIADGMHRLVDADDTYVAVFHVNGDFLAIEDVCTHDGGALAGGVLRGTEITCPRHGARFCLRTGAALSPPAYEPTRAFPVRVVDGVVQIRVGPAS